MTIEFACPQCGQSLRVPDEATGRNGKCPQCAMIFVVPGAANIAGVSAEGSALQRNPFADQRAVNAYDVGGIPAQPYSPAGLQQFGGELPVMPRAVDPGAIMALASSLWQRQLGLLLLTHLILLAIAFVLGAAEWMVLVNFYDYAPFFYVPFVESDSSLSYYLATSGMTLVSSIVQSYLWIGQVQICLKLARNQPADFADLFLAGGRFLPTLAASLVIVLPFWIVDLMVTLALNEGLTFGGFEAGIATGYAVLYFLAWSACVIFLWPVPYLIIDREATVLQSYGTAFRITQLNIGTSIVLLLISIAFTILGYCACLVGLLFALPFLTLCWSTAYLMFTGQIPAYNWLAEQSR